MNVSLSSRNSQMLCTNLLRHDRPRLQAEMNLLLVSQASYDPNNIAALLQQYPYHIDSLMAMFDLYRVRELRSGVLLEQTSGCGSGLVFAAWLP